VAGASASVAVPMTWSPLMASSDRRQRGLSSSGRGVGRPSGMRSPELGLRMRTGVPAGRLEFVTRRLWQALTRTSTKSAELITQLPKLFRRRHRICVSSIISPIRPGSRWNSVVSFGICGEVAPVGPSLRRPVELARGQVTRQATTTNLRGLSLVVDSEHGT
jgi:hypothetical protein